MSEHAALLQTYNQEFVKCLESLKRKRDGLKEIVERARLEKQKIEKEMETLNAKLIEIDKSLTHHAKMCEHYENKIKESEEGYFKIVESSQILLNLMKQETRDEH